MAYEDDKYPLDKLLKHPLALVTYAAVIIVILYYVMSPYQRCLRLWTDYEVTTVNQTRAAAKNTAKFICVGKGFSW